MSSSSLHVGILTGGGDCPGLNAVIRGVTNSLIKTVGARVTGIERGFMGMIERRSRPLDSEAVAGILNQGGTILGTHNFANPFSCNGVDVSDKVMEYVRELGLDALVAIGGDGTMSIANRFTPLGLPVVGVPKTIDNDLMHTERTFGFDSAVAIVAEALARLETTARSHGRVMVLETMGRYAGWIALEGGLAGGADVILIPEKPYDLNEVIRVCKEREKKQEEVFSKLEVGQTVAWWWPSIWKTARTRSGWGVWATCCASSSSSTWKAKCVPRSWATCSAVAPPRRMTACWPRALAGMPPRWWPMASSVAWWC